MKKAPETTTDTSYAEPVATVINGVPTILKPGTDEYEKALEKIYGKREPEPETAIDWLGRKPKEKPVTAKTGSIDTPEDLHHVLLMKDHLLDFPELWMSIYVLGPPEDRKGFAQLFSRANCRRAESLETADLVVFTGGPDVNPEYYGEKPHRTTYSHESRDLEDLRAYSTCLEQGIPMTGVCRGAQFLAVMNGYKLYQDVNNHQGDHQMWDVQQKMMIERVSSVHHQQVIPGAGMDILGIAYESTKRWTNDKDFREVVEKSRPFADLEAYFIRATCCLGVQGHPEYKDYNAFSKWYLEMIYNYIVLNPDMEHKDNCIRLKQDVIELRPKQEPLKGTN